MPSSPLPVSFRNPRGLCLRGILDRAGDDRILLLAHGFTSDKNSHGRFPQLAAIANRHGWSTLAFDFSGCGESEDAPITVEREIEDLRSAIAFTQELGFQQFGLVGNSLGARSCLQCADLRPLMMVLIGAALDAVHYNWIDYFTAEQLQELYRIGQIYYPVERKGRTECLLVQQTLDDFAVFDKNSILKRLRCPVLLIYGDTGWEEQTLLDTGRKALPDFPSGSRLEIVSGAQHGCKSHFPLVLAYFEAWLAAFQAEVVAAWTSPVFLKEGRSRPKPHEHFESCTRHPRSAAA